MAKEFKRKFMHPTRRKLADMVKTGQYEKNQSVGWEAKKENRKVGDVWEDEHYRYEKKEGYTLKTGKNSEVFENIRKYLQEQNECKNPDCDHVGEFGPNHHKDSVSSLSLSEDGRTLLSADKKGNICYWQTGGNK